MSTPQLDRLYAHCQWLRLYQVEHELSTLLEQAAKQDRSYSDFLEDLLSREIQAKSAKHLTMRLAMARFPFQKPLESFEFKFQPSIDAKVIRELATGRYLAHGENILLLGPPGALHHGHGAFGHAWQGARGEPARREAQAPDPAPPLDHRRDWVYPD